MKIAKMALALAFFATSTHYARSAEIKIAAGRIWLIGKIVSGDYDRFVYALRQNRSSIAWIELRSGGGSVVESIKIGRLIHQLVMNARAPMSPSYAPVVKPNCGDDISEVGIRPPCICASACFNIWVAGMYRMGTELAIHRISFEGDVGVLSPGDYAAAYEKGLILERTYLDEMKVPADYYQKMLTVPSSDVYKLRYEESSSMVVHPVFQEWLIARCGPVGVESSRCYAREIATAQQAAYNQFVNGLIP
jgi:hypothetical protein